MTDQVFYRATRHTLRDCYTVWVLWLIGYPARAIGSAMGMRTKSVAGIIQNSAYANRAAMCDVERASLLAQLEAARFENGQPIDGGRLDRIKFRIRPLSNRQRHKPSSRRIGVK